MIVKSMARRSPSFGQLLAYFNRPGEPTPAILHGLRTHEDLPDEVHRELLDNFRYLRRRKNGNALYHEVLSFGAGDRQGLTDEVLEDLVRHYVELRAPNALVYAKVHRNGSCVHVHLLISANDVGSTRRIRMSRAVFARVKWELEAYQRARYPDLVHSTAQEVREVRERRRRARQGRGEAERERRTRARGALEPSRKDLVRLRVEHQLLTARSEEGLYLGLGQAGLELYVRGRHAGVVDRSNGGRYRLATLGLADLLAERLVEWEIVRGRLTALHQVELEKARRRWLELGFREEIGLALVEGAGEGLDPRQQQLVRTLKDKLARSRGVRSAPELERR